MAYADDITVDNPARYWRLGETSGTTAVDAKGVGDLTHIGGVTVGVAGLLSDGSTDKAAQYDGASGYSRSAGYAWPTGHAWVEMIVKPATLPAAGQVAVLYRHGTDDLVAGTLSMQVVLLSDGSIRIDRGDQVGAATTLPGMVMPGKRSLISARHYDSAGTILNEVYVNGMQVHISAANGAISASTDASYRTMIGGTSAGGYFDGTIDEVSFWTGVTYKAQNFMVSHYLATGMNERTLKQTQTNTEYNIPLHWRFTLDETAGTTAADEATGPDATHYGGVLVGQPALSADGIGYSAYYNGTTACSEVATTFAWTNVALGMDLMIKPDGLPASNYWIIARLGTLTGLGPYAWELRLYPDGSLRMEGAGMVLNSPAGVVASGGTYHIGYYKNGNYKELWVNGRMVASITSTGTASSTAYNFMIGGGQNAAFNGYRFKGHIDEITIRRSNAPHANSIIRNAVAAGVRDRDYLTEIASMGMRTPGQFNPFDDAAGTTTPLGYTWLATSNGTHFNGAVAGQAALGTYDSTGKSVYYDGVNDISNLQQGQGMDISTDESRVVGISIKPVALPTTGNVAYLWQSANTFSGTFRQYYLQLRADGGLTFIPALQGAAAVSAPAGTIAVGQEYKIICTFDIVWGTRIYVNGTLVASNASGTFTNGSSSTYFVGGGRTGASATTYFNHFNGYIDDFWALTDVRISPTIVSNLYALWNPDTGPTVVEADPLNTSSTLTHAQSSPQIAYNGAALNVAHALTSSITGGVRPVDADTLNVEAVSGTSVVGGYKPLPWGRPRASRVNKPAPPARLTIHTRRSPHLRD